MYLNHAYKFGGFFSIWIEYLAIENILEIWFW